MVRLKTTTTTAKRRRPKPAPARSHTRDTSDTRDPHTHTHTFMRRGLGPRAGFRVQGPHRGDALRLRLPTLEQGEAATGPLEQVGANGNQVCAHIPNIPEGAREATTQQAT